MVRKLYRKEASVGLDHGVLHGEVEARPCRLIVDKGDEVDGYRHVLDDRCRREVARPQEHRLGDADVIAGRARSRAHALHLWRLPGDSEPKIVCAHYDVGGGHSFLPPPASIRLRLGLAIPALLLEAEICRRASNAPPQQRERASGAWSGPSCRSVGRCCRVVLG